jgi:hypothetical protein
MGERVAELAALVDRARCRRADVTGDASRGRELTHELHEPGLVLGDLGIDLGVGPLQPKVRDHRRSAVAGAGDEEDVLVCAPDQRIEVCVDEVEARSCAPVPERPRFDVLGAKRFAQQGIRLQIQLRRGQVVRGAPPLDRSPVVR